MLLAKRNNSNIKTIILIRQSFIPQSSFKRHSVLWLTRQKVCMLSNTPICIHMISNLRFNHDPQFDQDTKYFVWERWNVIDKMKETLFRVLPKSNLTFNIDCTIKALYGSCYDLVVNVFSSDYNATTDPNAFAFLRHGGLFGEERWTVKQDRVKMCTEIKNLQYGNKIHQFWTRYCWNQAILHYMYI